MLRTLFAMRRAASFRTYAKKKERQCLACMLTIFKNYCVCAICVGAHPQLPVLHQLEKRWAGCVSGSQALARAFLGPKQTALQGSAPWQRLQ